MKIMIQTLTITLGTQVKFIKRNIQGMKAVVTVKQIPVMNTVNCSGLKAALKAMPESVNVPIELDSENYFRFRSSTRQSVKSKRRFRSREPSRTSLKKILQSLKNKKLRKKLKNTIKKLTPVSSTAYDIAENYKWWNGRYIHQQDSFYSSYFQKIKLSRSSVIAYNISQKNILLSGDVELNPGPITNGNSSLALISNTRADFLLNYRLYTHGLRALNVDGGGDYFLKSVSHQLFGDSSHHLAIRYTAVQYLRENPERFIEGVVDRWSQYLHSMSMQGTWADRTVIQA